MKKKKNQRLRLSNVIAMAFLLISLMCFVVQAADLPCCNKCDPFCEYTSASNGSGWKNCVDDRREGHEDCDPQDWGECSGC